MQELLKELQALTIPLTGEAKDPSGQTYKHVELGPLMDTINEVLDKFNAYIVQPMFIVGQDTDRPSQGFYTVLKIGDNEVLKSTTLLPYKADARQVAGQYGILKKYAIIGMLGLKVEEKEPERVLPLLPEADMKVILTRIEGGASPTELIEMAEKTNTVSPEQRQKILKHGTKK